MMKFEDFREFKPTTFFLVKFLVIYVAGNLLYGVFVSSYGQRPDILTRVVTSQTSFLLSGMGWSTSVVDDQVRPTTFIKNEGRSIIAVYEGCNGINVMIIFVGFIFSFGGSRQHMWWFILLGLALIHLLNLIRLMLLFVITIELPRYLYFTHKYLFTSVIYLLTFILWIWWVKVYGIRTKAQ